MNSGKKCGNTSAAKLGAEQKQAFGDIELSLVFDSIYDVRASAENWLWAFVDEVSDYLFVKDDQSRFVMANAKTAVDLGFPSADYILGKTDLELHPPKIGRKFFEDEQRILKFGEPSFELDDALVLPDGRKKWFTTSKFPVRNRNGEIIGLVGIARDITDRQNALLFQREQTEVLEMIASGAPLRSTLNTLVLMIEGQLDDMMGSVALMDNHGSMLTGAAAPKFPESFREAYSDIAVGPTAGLCGRAVHQRSPMIIEDIYADGDWTVAHQMVADADMKCSWSFPFFASNGQVLGCFDVFSKTSRRPTGKELLTLKEAARFAAIAVSKDAYEKKIEYLAHYDRLTGLPNRNGIGAYIESQIALCKDNGTTLAVIFINLDKFKCVNDHFNHAVGDQVLRILAERLNDLSGFISKISRFSGDEFVLITKGRHADQDKLPELIRIIRSEFAKTINISDLSFYVTCSVGAACFPQHGETADQLLNKANQAMHAVKKTGRDYFQIFDEADAAPYADNHALLEQIRQGIERGEFFLEYQPQLDIHENKITGIEALVRWKHPERGRMLPANFIAAAEESGLIVELGQTVLREACSQIKAWHDQGFTDIKVAVNVSARQFSGNTLIADIQEALSANQIPPECLEIELTESLLIHREDIALGVMNELRQLGVQLAIDDFGTGYSSLSTLSKFPLTRLKMDKSFIHDLDHDANKRAIAQSIILLGHQLGMTVVAEGIETEQQHALLSAYSCDAIQGYLIGKPMSAQHIAKMLAAQKTDKMERLC